MAKKTNCTINGKEYYRIYRKVGMKRNKLGIWVDDRRAFYGSCKRDAEEAYQAYMEKKRSGLGSMQCFGQLIEQWMEEVFQYSDLANSTKVKYMDAYKALLQSHRLAGMAITEITAMDIQKFYNSQNCSETALRSVHNLLRRFFKYAELQGVCRNITHSLTIPKKAKRNAPDDRMDELTVDVWDDDDLKKLIRSMEHHRLQLLIILAVNTGCRIGELLALSYEDIRDGRLYVSKQLVEIKQIGSLQNGQSKWSQQIEPPKTPTSNRVIPLSDVILEEIEKHKIWQRKDMLKNGYRTKYLFTTANGTWYYKRNIARALTRIYRRIGVPYHKFHSFRHTFGTNLSRAGVPIEETSKLMGHADIDITAKYYIAVNAARKKEAIDKILKYSLL